MPTNSGSTPSSGAASGASTAATIDEQERMICAASIAVGGTSENPMRDLRRQAGGGQPVAPPGGPARNACLGACLDGATAEMKIAFDTGGPPVLHSSTPCRIISTSNS